jgi:hypothetical protein
LVFIKNGLFGDSFAGIGYLSGIIPNILNLGFVVGASF